MARGRFTIAAYAVFFALVVVAFRILDVRDILESAESRTLLFTSNLHLGDDFYFINNALESFDDLLVLVLVNMGVVHSYYARDLTAQTPKFALANSGVFKCTHWENHECLSQRIHDPGCRESRGNYTRRSTNDSFCGDKVVY